MFDFLWIMLSIIGWVVILTCIWLISITALEVYWKWQDRMHDKSESSSRSNENATQ